MEHSNFPTSFPVSTTHERLLEPSINTNLFDLGNSPILCCTGPSSMQGLSALVRPDGSFEFPGVPAGMYTIEIDGLLHVVQPTISKGDVPKVEVTIDSLRRSGDPLKIEISGR